LLYRKRNPHRIRERQARDARLTLFQQGIGGSGVVNFRPLSAYAL